MQIITDPAEMQAIAEKLRLQHQYIGVVMTMGALHEGHLSLVKLAREKAGTVIMTLFVNPTQFGPDEDFHRYPRPFEQDAALARSAGVDYLFAPSTEAMYPEGYSTSIDPGPIATRFEGASRPGHFSGMATVVVKLLGITRPHLAIFGEKDAQQLTIIRRVVADLDIAVVHQLQMLEHVELELRQEAGEAQAVLARDLGGAGIAGPGARVAPGGGDPVIGDADHRRVGAGEIGLCPRHRHAEQARHALAQRGHREAAQLREFRVEGLACRRHAALRC